MSEQKMNRRDFLRISGAALAGALLAGCRPLADQVLPNASGDDISPAAAPELSTVDPSEAENIRIASSKAPATGAVEANVIGSPQVFPLSPDVLLPDGRPFKTWIPELVFNKTYYVNGSSPFASDTNPATQERPFKTIGRAALVLEPGQRVLVAAGIYYEQVTPKLGGISPQKMISYQAMPGAKVIVRATLPLTGRWEPSEMANGAWKLRLVKPHRPVA